MLIRNEMHNSTYLIFALLICATISACTPGPTPQTNQESDVDVVPEFIDTPLPSQEESFNPTESSPATPKPTRTVESISSTAMIVEPPATNTIKPSATSTFEPTEISRGNFYGVDENHVGVGNAIIIQTQVGKYSLQLENFEVTNGPGLHVILAEANNPYSVATLGDYLDLGELKSTRGDQIYALPNAVDLGYYGSVVVYCLPFEAIFAIAPIR